LKIRILLIFIITIFSSSVFSTNIRVLDFQQIIENNNNFISLYNQIEKDQKIHKIKFEKEEIYLQNELKRIDKLNLILEPIEIEKQVESYNNELINFNKKIEKFNFHYERQINNLKTDIINLTLEILQKYSLDNKIDLILDSNNYVLSNNSINITDLIIELLNKKKMEINFEKY
jgi:Skp family chaperone for outer membrane proteins